MEITESTLIELHTITYTKGNWYKRNDIIKDLAVFQGHWSAMDPKHLSELDVLWYISTIHKKYIPSQHRNHDVGAFLMDAFKPFGENLRKSLTIRDVVQKLCDNIRYGVDRSNVPFWVAPDPKYLPVSENALERFNEIHGDS